MKEVIDQLIIRLKDLNEFCSKLENILRYDDWCTFAEAYDYIRDAGIDDPVACLNHLKCECSPAEFNAYTTHIRSAAESYMTWYDSRSIDIIVWCSDAYLYNMISESVDSDSRSDSDSLVALGNEISQKLKLLNELNTFIYTKCQYGMFSYSSLSPEEKDYYDCLVRRYRQLIDGIYEINKVSKDLAHMQELSSELEERSFDLSSWQSTTYSIRMEKAKTDVMGALFLVCRRYAEYIRFCQKHGSTGSEFKEFRDCFASKDVYDDVMAVLCSESDHTAESLSALCSVLINSNLVDARVRSTTVLAGLILKACPDLCPGVKNPASVRKYARINDYLKSTWKSKLAGDMHD